MNEGTDRHEGWNSDLDEGLLDYLFSSFAFPRFCLVYIWYLHIMMLIVQRKTLLSLSKRGEYNVEKWDQASSQPTANDRGSVRIARLGRMWTSKSLVLLMRNSYYGTFYGLMFCFLRMFYKCVWRKCAQKAEYGIFSKFDDKKFSTVYFQQLIDFIWNQKITLHAKEISHGYNWKKHFWAFCSFIWIIGLKCTVHCKCF